MFETGNYIEAGLWIVIALACGTHAAFAGGVAP